MGVIKKQEKRANAARNPRGEKDKSTGEKKFGPGLFNTEKRGGGRQQGEKTFSNMGNKKNKKKNRDKQRK